MRLLHLSLASAATAMVLPSYKLPADFPISILASGDCVMPQKFSVTDLQMWLPALTNNEYNTTVEFRFTDSGTSIDTTCHRNATSPNVADDGDTPRWACADPTVQFIWQDSTLTIIEKACPNSGGRGFEASGSLQPGFNCKPTENGTWPLGDGFWCEAVDQPLAGNFTSLQPGPPPPSTTPAAVAI
ncbi:hypothetical protein OQA88_3898 [Cercophora sp. LCS_1]